MKEASGRLLGEEASGYEQSGYIVGQEASVMMLCEVKLDKIQAQTVYEKVEEVDQRYQRTQKEVEEEHLLNVSKYSFPYRSTDVWSSLDKETVNAKNVHGFNVKLDIKRHYDRTA